MLKNKILFAIFLPLMAACCVNISWAAVTMRILQGDTVYVNYPMSDSCFIRVDVRKHKTNWPISDPQGFESEITIDKSWLSYDGTPLYDGSHTGNAEDTLIIRLKILSNPAPTPDEVSTVEVSGAGYIGIARIRIVAVPKTPDDKCSSEGQPMHPYQGDQYLTRNDIALNGRGLNINFVRSYSSNSMESPDPNESLAWTLPFGTGWTHNYNLFYTLEGGYPYAAKNLTVKRRDNRRILHCCKWNNTYSTYEAKAGEHNSILIQTVGADSIWAEKQTDGTVYYYKRLADLSVRLDSIKDNNGNRLKFAYTGNNLTKITDAVNRDVNITYSGNLIQRLYQPPSTSAPYMAYEYDNVNGRDRLIRVSKHTNTATDTTVVLDKYIYNGGHLMITRQLPSGKYSDNNDTARSRKKGDRLSFWYDAKKRLKYEEAVMGDGDTLLTNDRVVYRAQYRYLCNADSLLDSTVIFYYEDSTYVGSLDPLNDTVPSLPTTKYYRKVYRYNSDGTIAKIMLHNPATGDTSCTTYSDYDGDFNPRQVTDPNGSLTKYGYVSYKDSAQNWRRLPLPDTIAYPNNDTAFTYYAAKAGNKLFFSPDSSFDELRNKTFYLYDASGNDTAVIYKSRVLADGDTNHHDITTRYHYYGGYSNLKETLDPLGHKSRMYYAPDSAGAYLAQQRVIMSSDTGSNDIVTKYGYNVNKGTLDTMSFYRDYPSNPSSTYYDNDLFQRPRKITNPDNSYDSLVYDKRGNTLEKYTRKSDTTWFKIAYEYNTLDQLTKAMEYRSPNDSATAYDSTLYRYNLHGKLEKLTNPLGKFTNYSYAMDRLIKTAYADTTYDSLVCYRDGSLRVKRDRKGQVLEYIYDGTSSGCGCPNSSRYRLVSKRFYNDTAQYNQPPHIPTDTVHFDYDKIGNRIKMVDKLGATQYAYDGLYRLKTDSCGYLNTKINYEYDQAGNRTRMKVTKGDSATVVYLDQTYSSYDNANRLGRTTYNNVNTDFTYWDTGTPKLITSADTVWENYTLTTRGFIDSVNTNYYDYDLVGHKGTWFKHKYSYNGLGDRTSQYLSLTRPGTSVLSGMINYKYDAFRRLTEAAYPAGMNSGATVDYTYDAAGNRARINGNVVYDYSYNGANNQMTKVRDYEAQTDKEFFRYDDNGNLACDSVLSGSKYYYYTNDFENRITKVKQSSDSTVFYYNGDGYRLKKISTSDTNTQYIPDGMYAVVERTNGSRVRYKYVYANGLLLARIDSLSNTRYYSHDALGSIVGISDASGVYKSYLYDEFGDSIGTWGSTPYNTYRYTGQDYDAKPINAYNLKARVYYPKLGRFMQNDPIGDNGGSSNWYSYVANNPLNMIDPLGKQNSDCLGRYEPCRGLSGVMRWFCEKVIIDAIGCTGTKGATCCWADLQCCFQKLGYPIPLSRPDPNCSPENEDANLKKCYKTYFNCLTAGAVHTR